MKAYRSLRSNLTTLIGIVICAWGAVMLCLFFRVQHTKAMLPMLPIAFLVLVILVAMRCGISAGVLGSIVSALIFAVFLYQPLGSVEVADKAARSTLGWMVLGGLTLSYLLGQKSGTQHHG
ncbi:MAG TPA: DUF4118 domain-containing protein [Terriglobales bacterium]|nr:DUF4118 domain-containing protein [Terriglobales bacterium]